MAVLYVIIGQAQSGAGSLREQRLPGPCDQRTQLRVTEGASDRMSQSTNPLDSQPQESPSAAPDTSWAHNAIADSQTCPLCFAPVADNGTREVREVMLATYTCGGEGAHRWNVSWVLSQVAA